MRRAEKYVSAYGVFFCLFAFLFFMPCAAQAQSTYASITGTVTDTSGAVVPNATITVTNVDTSVRHIVKSNRDGIYVVPQLNPGSYSVVVQASGFSRYAVTDILLNARNVRRIDATLQVGKVSTHVTVTGGATLIDTENARITHTQLSYQMNQLPLDTGAMWAFLALAPGVLQQPGQSTIMINGSRGGQDNWSIDGTTFSDGIDNTQNGPLGNYTEPFQAIQTNLANNSAQYGAMGQIMLISKSGTNHFHGDVFDRYTTPMFLARNPFASQRASYISHNIGASLGGPLYIPKVYDGRNKTFFFISYEAYLGSGSVGLYNDTVPTQAWRNGNFSDLLPAVKIYNPQTGQPFAGNIIPADLINPVSQKLQNMFYSLPNTGNVNVFQPENFRQNYDFPALTDYMWSIRLDQHFNSKNSGFVRVSWQHNPGNFPQNMPSLGPWTETRVDEDDTLSYTHIFSPTVVNDFRFGYDYNDEPIFTPINGAQFVNNLGLQGLAPNLPTKVSGVTAVNFSDLGISPIRVSENYAGPGYLNRTYQIQDNVSWFHGKHYMKFGIQIGHVDWNNYSVPSDLFGSMTFAPTYTSGGIAGQGNAYADFLLGMPTNASRSFAPIEQESYRSYYDFFAEDQYKVTSTSYD